MPDTDEPTFGARFLDEWKSLGGPLSRFSYAEIQELRVCDREGMIEALRRQSSMVEHRTIRRIREVESPEQLARETLSQLQTQAAAGTSMWVLIGLIG